MLRAGRKRVPALLQKGASGCGAHLGLGRALHAHHLARVPRDHIHRRRGEGARGRACRRGHRTRQVP